MASGVERIIVGRTTPPPSREGSRGAGRRGGQNGGGITTIRISLHFLMAFAQISFLGNVPLFASSGFCSVLLNSINVHLLVHFRFFNAFHTLNSFLLLFVWGFHLFVSFCLLLSSFAFEHDLSPDEQDELQAILCNSTSARPNKKVGNCSSVHPHKKSERIPRAITNKNQKPGVIRVKGGDLDDA